VWEVPVEATGRWIHVVFQGMVDDVRCTAHPGSDDRAVNMSMYRAKIAVPKIERIEVSGITSAGSANTSTVEGTTDGEPIIVYTTDVLHLRAIISPVGSSLPAGQPVWFAYRLGDGDGRSEQSDEGVVIEPSSGSADVKVYNFRPSWYRVEASMCSGSASTRVLAGVVNFVRAYEAQGGHHVNRIIEEKIRDEGGDPVPDTNTLYIVAEENKRVEIILKLYYQPDAIQEYIRYSIDDLAAGISWANGVIEGEETFISFDEPPREREGTLLYGLDKNRNGKLEADEYPEELRTKRVLKIQPYKDKTWRLAFRFLRFTARLSGYVYPLASTLLRLFISSGTIEGSLGKDRKPSRKPDEAFNCFTDNYAPWLTHNAGLMYTDGGDSTITHYFWGPGHDLCRKFIATSDEVVDRVRQIFQKNKVEIDKEIEKFCRDPNVQPGTEKMFGPWDEKSAGLEDVFLFRSTYNLYYGLARVKVDYHSIMVKVKKEGGGCKITGIESSGSISDLYDFNVMYKSGGLAWMGAVVELGWDAGGQRKRGGKIFKDTFEWRYMFTGKELSKIIWEEAK
jgi:hypothetical protein